MTLEQEKALNEVFPQIFRAIINQKNPMPIHEAEEIIKSKLPRELAEEIDVEEVLGQVQGRILTTPEKFGVEVLTMIQKQSHVAA